MGLGAVPWSFRPSGDLHRWLPAHSHLPLPVAHLIRVPTALLYALTPWPGWMGPSQTSPLTPICTLPPSHTDTQHQGVPEPLGTLAQRPLHLASSPAPPRHGLGPPLHLPYPYAHAGHGFYHTTSCLTRPRLRGQGSGVTHLWMPALLLGGTQTWSLLGRKWVGGPPKGDACRHWSQACSWLFYF